MITKGAKIMNVTVKNENKEYNVTIMGVTIISENKRHNYYERK